MNLRQGEGGRLSDKAFEIPLEEFDQIIGKNLCAHLNYPPMIDEECIGEDLLRIISS
jgi:hypothetical protein